MAKKEAVLAKLDEVLEADTTRTKKGRIWPLYDKIVEMKKSGMSVTNIEAHLNKLVFTNGESDKLKPGSLTSYLYQIRKERGIEKVAPVERPPKNPKRRKGDLENAKAGETESKSEVAVAGDGITLSIGRKKKFTVTPASTD